MISHDKTDWQPIETAPRDGWFVVWWRDGRPSVDRFYSPEHLALIRSAGAIYCLPLPPPPEGADGH